MIYVIQKNKTSYKTNTVKHSSLYIRRQTNEIYSEKQSSDEVSHLRKYRNISIQKNDFEVHKYCRTSLNDFFNKFQQ